MAELTQCAFIHPYALRALYIERSTHIASVCCFFFFFFFFTIYLFKRISTDTVMLIAVTLVAVIICADVVPAQEDVCYEGTDNAYAIRKLRATHITTAFYGGGQSVLTAILRIGLHWTAVFFSLTGFFFFSTFHPPHHRIERMQKYNNPHGRHAILDRSATASFRGTAQRHIFSSSS